MSAAIDRRPPSRMTLDEFLAWDSETFGAARWQLIDGEAVAMAPARDAHGSMQIELGRLLANHLLQAGVPCRVVSEPGIVPKLSASGNYRVPDLGVTCAPPGDTLMVPEPVLLVEIMSPNNRAITRANIWAYATIPSVQEILVLQSTRIEAELLRRGADGGWPAEPETVAANGALDLRSIGFTIPLTSVYRTTFLAR